MERKQIKQIKKFKNFRFSDLTINRLTKFAARKKVTMTHVVESLIANYCKTSMEEKASYERTRN